MSPSEFEAWINAYQGTPEGEEGDYWRERIIEIVNARVAIVKEYERPNDMAEIADAIRWAAFWIALGAVLTALVVMGLA